MGVQQTDQRESCNSDLKNHPLCPNTSEKPTFEKQLEIFKELGFNLNPGVDASDLYLNRGRGGKGAFENSIPYMLMYRTLGQIIHREPWTPITNKVYDFDAEAIENHGDYIRILENVSRITNGELVLENIDDYIDIDKGIVWVSFTCKGDHYKWYLEVIEDYVGDDLFEKLQSLAEKYQTKGRFTYLTTGGQDLALGYHMPEEIDRIKKVTGLNIVKFKTNGQI